MQDEDVAPKLEGTAAKAQGSSTSLLNNLPGMVFRCLYDDEHSMLFVSRGCEALTGYKADDLLNSVPKGFRELILAQDRVDVLHKINLAVKERRPYQLIYRIVTAVGKERWVREEGQALYTVDGSVEALEGIITDHQEQMMKFRLLEQRVADRTGRLSALYDILEVASDAASPQTTIARILERILKAVALEAGAIHLLDSSGEHLQLVAQQGLPDTILESSSTLTLQESPLVGWVARQGSPLLIPRVSQDERAITLAEQGSFGTYAGVPITATDQIYGVLSVLAQEESRFPAQEEVDLLVSVGEQIGVVVENAQLRQQAEQLMIVEERNRLARELHDSVTQSLYSVTLFAEAGRRMIVDGDTEQAKVYLVEVAETGRQALKEMRLLVHRLRPSVLAKEGLARAIQHRLNAVEGRAGVITRLLVEGELELAPALEEALYYITQEALNNALKHAVATEVVVVIRAHEGGDVELQISDNGRGFDPDAVLDMGGLGLTSMRERAELFGGKVTCKSSMGQGTTIHADFRSNQKNMVDTPLAELF